jgi:hypothetical protein
VFVDFVKNDRNGRPPVALVDDILEKQGIFFVGLQDGRIIPVEIGSLHAALFEPVEGEGRLADLPGTGQKDHLSRDEFGIEKIDSTKR